MDFWTRICESLLHYETYKVLDIKSKRIGVFYRLMQATVIGFAIFYIAVKKGYQERDTGISTLRMKLKGAGFLKSHRNLFLYNTSLVVYDPADYVIPPNQETSIFVMTSRIGTPNQVQQKCPEDPQFRHNWCNTDDDCKPALEMVKRGNGIRTGACVKSDRKPSINVCEIYGWCPTEDENQWQTGYNLTNGAELPYLKGSEDFTLFVKNQVRFPKFDIALKNLISNKYLRQCSYNQTHRDNSCPIFKLRDIIEICGDRFEEVAVKGATYGIIINWNCDFDQAPESCRPTYNFKRFHRYRDGPHGYNFRYANYYEHNGVRHRALTKAYGLKFQVLVNARAGKFAFESLFVALGASIANLAVCKVICDILVLRCGPKKRKYSEMKIQQTKVRTSELSFVDNSET